LKQSHHAWYSRLTDKLQSVGFTPSKADISLFYYKRGSITIYLLIYVDDIIAASSSSYVISDLLLTLQDDFDLGPLHYFLDIEVQKSDQALCLSQKKYIADLLQRAGMIKCKPVTTPLSSNSKLSAVDGELLSKEDATKYHSIIRALQYLMLTRPDISYSVNKVCQYLHSSTTSHMSVVKRILRFPQYTRD
jgi:hypothetical protein